MSSKNAEIINLLNQIGLRLIRSEKERNTLVDVVRDTRQEIADLAARSDNTEQVFLGLQNQISKAETMDQALRKKQDYLEKKQQEQLERIERAIELTDKLEQALSQQAQIMRRLDRMGKDRSRLTQQIERIEETVIDTQEALKSKALAVPELGDTSIAAPRKEIDAANDDNFLGTWAKKVGSFGVFFVTAILAGWVISNIQHDNSISTALVEHDLIPKITTADNTDSNTDAIIQAFEQENALDPRMADIDITAPLENKLQKIEPDANTNTNAISMPDIELAATNITSNEELEELAAQLNDIAPTAGTTPPEQVEKTGLKTKKESEKKPFTKKVSFTQDKKEAATTVKPLKPKEKLAGNTADPVKRFLESQALPGTIKDRIKSDGALPASIREIEEKAFEGMKEAQHDLAAIYTAGHGGVDINYEKAARWFHEAALQDVPNARYNLGVLYHQGLGVKQDIQTAVGWYRAAAQSGHAEALYNLGIAHIEGIGTGYSPHLAASFFERAAKQGVMEAAYNLGLIYENGLLGGKPQKDKALNWYTQAAKRGSQQAKSAMEELGRSMDMKESEIMKLLGEDNTKESSAVPTLQNDEPETRVVKKKIQRLTISRQT